MLNAPLIARVIRCVQTSMRGCNLCLDLQGPPGSTMVLQGPPGPSAVLQGPSGPSRVAVAYQLGCTSCQRSSTQVDLFLCPLKHSPEEL